MLDDFETKYCKTIDALWNYGEEEKKIFYYFSENQVQQTLVLDAVYQDDNPFTKSSLSLSSYPYLALTIAIRGVADEGKPQALALHTKPLLQPKKTQTI